MQSFMIENSAFVQLVLILKKFIIPDFRVTYKSMILTNSIQYGVFYILI